MKRSFDTTRPRRVRMKPDSETLHMLLLLDSVIKDASTAFIPLIEWCRQCVLVSSQPIPIKKNTNERQ